MTLVRIYRQVNETNPESGHVAEYDWIAFEAKGNVFVLSGLRHAAAESLYRGRVSKVEQAVVPVEQVIDVDEASRISVDEIVTGDGDTYLVIVNGEVEATLTASEFKAIAALLPSATE